MQVVNWQLASHPMNWVILFLMVFIAGIAVHIVASAYTTPDNAA